MELQQKRGQFSMTYATFSPCESILIISNRKGFDKALSRLASQLYIASLMPMPSGLFQVTLNGSENKPLRDWSGTPMNKL